MQLRAVVDGLLRSPADAGTDHQQPTGTEATGATVPELPSHSAIRRPSRRSRLNPKQRAELVEVLARIITKAAGAATTPPALPSPASKEPVHD